MARFFAVAKARRPMESVQDRVLKIREALQTKSHLEAARLIAEAKRAEQKRLKKGLEFDLPPTHFTKYLRVGLCTRLHERNIVQRLPQSIETLYELSLLKPATWSELVGDEAKLKPTLTRRECANCERESLRLVIGWRPA